MKVTVLGAAGGIGQPLALLLKLQLPAGSTLALYDVVNVAGVAVDLSHINTPVSVQHFNGDLKKPEDTTQLDRATKDAQIVVIPAGVPRKPGQTRDDLFKVNAGIVRNLISSCARNCPNALIAIITNPVNSTVPIAAEVLKAHGVFNPKKLFGVTTLDLVRAQTFVAELKKVSPSIRVPVVGGHSGNTILPLLSQVDGARFSNDEIAKLTDRIQNAGTEVVNAKAGAGSATLSMAYAAARFTGSLVKALQGTRVVEYTYVATNDAPQDAGYFAVPVELGPNGIERSLPIGNLSSFEQGKLNEMLPELKSNVAAGVNFTKAKL